MTCLILRNLIHKHSYYAYQLLQSVENKYTTSFVLILELPKL